MSSALGSVMNMVLIISGAMVISRVNGIYSVLWLVTGFLSAVVLLIKMGAEYLGLVVLVVYVGAIAVLFVFVVMMLDLSSGPEARTQLWGSRLDRYRASRAGRDRYEWNDLSHYAPLGVIVGFIILGVLSGGALWMEEGVVNYLGCVSDIGALGSVLYSEYGDLLILGSYILLVAMIGAIILTNGDSEW